MDVSIETSHYNDKSRYYDGFSVTEAYRNYEISLYSVCCFIRGKNIISIIEALFLSLMG